MGSAGAVSKTFNIAAAALIVLLAIGLYRAKTEADVARARVAALETQVAEARAQVKSLAAESAFLENPARIEKLARQQLALRPAALAQHKPLAALASALPAPAKPAAHAAP
jgi:cell division protein FtsL